MTTIPEAEELAQKVASMSPEEKIEFNKRQLFGLAQAIFPQAVIVMILGFPQGTETAIHVGSNVTKEDEILILQTALLAKQEPANDQLN